MSATNIIVFSDGLKNLIVQNYNDPSVGKIKKRYDESKIWDNEKKSALDQAFREVLVTMLNGDIKQCEALIKYSLNCQKIQMCSMALPITLIADIFEAVTLDKCEVMFSFVEQNITVWKEPSFFAACKNNILRMCNDLLRRLSRSQDTVFCGRILLFLAKFFPFSERSGLNVVSEFNLENLTEYDCDGKDMDEPLIDSEDIPLKIDYNLYCKFWGLQNYFRNPNQCYSKTEWKTFSTYASNVLASFNSYKLEETRLDTTDETEPMDVDMKPVADVVNDSHHFFAKFLTNPKLLALQLADSNFRRSVLIQFLILFQYLTSSVKFKTDDHVLSASQSEFIKETEVEIYKLLEETPPNGVEFAKAVRHILSREEMWNNWKNEGCKEFKRPGSNLEDSPPAAKHKRQLGDFLKEASNQGKFYLGNTELTRLWNLCPDNLHACRGADRNFLPSIETYLATPKDKVDPSFEWRALRLLSRQSPHFFNVNNPPSNKISDYLDSVRKKILKDKADGAASQEMQEPKQEPPEAESEKDDNFCEVPDDSELLRPEPLTPEDRNSHKTMMPSDDQIKQISKSIGKDWKKLGAKLGVEEDVMQYYESEYPEMIDQCVKLLKVWFEDDLDANLDNLAYILEGLQMMAPCNLIKSFIESSH